ncbi:uncharacterized protein [Pyrus communis]|uniref:uncharacterized protein isoform X1 n=1 Tax=Pyrus communis TaxID=23211 RepID=UPI0035BFF600
MIHPLLLQFMNFHYIKHLINLLLCDLLPNLCVGSDFGAEDPPRHVGNEGFRIFGESDQAIPEALPSRLRRKNRKVKKKRRERRIESFAHANVLLGDVGAGKSSLVLRFVKEQFVEFQDSRCKIEGYLVVLHGVG